MNDFEAYVADIQKRTGCSMAEAKRYARKEKLMDDIRNAEIDGEVKNLLLRIVRDAA